MTWAIVSQYSRCIVTMRWVARQVAVSRHGLLPGHDTAAGGARTRRWAQWALGARSRLSERVCGVSWQKTRRGARVSDATRQPGAAIWPGASTTTRPGPATIGPTLRTPGRAWVPAGPVLVLVHLACFSTWFLTR